MNNCYGINTTGLMTTITFGDKLTGMFPVKIHNDDDLTSRVGIMFARVTEEDKQRPVVDFITAKKEQVVLDFDSPETIDKLITILERLKEIPCN